MLITLLQTCLSGLIETHNLHIVCHVNIEESVMIIRLQNGFSVTYSDYCLTEDFVLCTVGSYLICTLIKNCMLDGKMNFLKHLQPLMVLSKAE